jgi:hypothetical protein
VFSLCEPPLFTRLRESKRVLIAGAGGGFDVHAGLPLAFALRDAGEEVHFANLSFVNLDQLDLDVWLAPGLSAIVPAVEIRGIYFPERTLSRWLETENLPSTVHAFPRTASSPTAPPAANCSSTRS